MTEKADHGKYCKGNLGRTDVLEETSCTTGMQDQNKGSRLKTAATSEEGEKKWQWHQRTELKTAATTRKHGKCERDL
jgi:hypothetical protein